MNLSYREFDSALLPEILEIYRRAGWAAYLGDDEKLARAFDCSLYILGAFIDGQLVGFIRCVGDGEHIVYVQDLIVDVPFKRRGVGSTLLRRVMERFSHVRMFTLITDASDEPANAFYRAMGMKRYSDRGVAGYMR